MIRKLFDRFNKSISERIVPQRFPAALPIKLTFEPEGRTGRLRSLTENLWIMGETSDLSETGLAFTVSSIRLKENYLVGEGKSLNAEIDLPNGRIQMKIVGQRYEQIDENASVTKYLIGAKILQITGENKDVYEEFLKNGNKLMKTKLLQLKTHQR